MDSSDIDPFVEILRRELVSVPTFKTFYLPSAKIRNLLCTKILKCSASDFNAIFIETADMYNVLLAKRRFLQQKLILLWTTAFMYIHKLFTNKTNKLFESDGKLITHDGKEIKYDGSSSALQVGFSGMVYIQYINGIVLTDGIVTLLKRTLSNFDQRKSNPFFEPKDTRSFHPVFLPDIDYLPQLYQELEVSGFDEIPKEVVKMLRLSDGKIEGIVANASVWLFLTHENGERYDIVDVYGSQRSTEWRFLSRYPSSIVLQARNRIANLRGTMPVQEMSKDVLQKITDGQIKGKDLIALCVSSPAINRICNSDDQALFKRRLQHEFGLKWSNDLIFETGFTTVRKLYVQLHQFYYWVQPYTRTDDTQSIHFVQLWGGKNVSTIEKLKGIKEYNSPGKIIVPLNQKMIVATMDRTILYFECFNNSQLSFIYVPTNREFYGFSGVKALATEKELKNIMSEAERLSGTIEDGIAASFFDIGGENYTFKIYVKKN